MTNRLLPVDLMAALIGGSVGALVMHKSQPAAAETTAQQANYTPVSSQQQGQKQLDNQAVPAEFTTATEQTAYKTGFADGFNGCTRGADNRMLTNGRTVAYRNAVSRTAPRRVYYDYNRPRGRTFWQKHRNKFTVGKGTGAGALMGGLIDDEDGAPIGELGGEVRSHVYTF